MSALATLAIVAGALLAVVVAAGVATAVKTRVMQDQDLALAEALAGERLPPPPEPRARGRSRLARDAAERQSILEEAARWRSVLEDAVSRWQRTPEERMSLAERAAARWREEPGDWRSFIDDLIETGRRPYAGMLLLSVSPEPIEPILVGTVTWYRDHLLSLHPAYLATNASLLDRVTQLITLTIDLEQGGDIPARRRYLRNPG